MRARAKFGIGVFFASVALLPFEAWLATRGPRVDAPGEIEGIVVKRPGGSAQRHLWLGDSTAAGVGANSVDGTVARRVATLSSAERVQITVFGESGARIQDVVDDQLPRVASFRADVIFISVGANDATHVTNRKDFVKRYDALLSQLPKGPRVVLLGVPDMGSPPRFAQPLRALAGWRGRVLDGEIRALARKHGVRYVDIAGPTGPRFRAKSSLYFARDKFHRSDAGYELWAKAVAGAMSL